MNKHISDISNTPVCILHLYSVLSPVWSCIYMVYRLQYDFLTSTDTYPSILLVYYKLFYVRLSELIT